MLGALATFYTLSSFRSRGAAAAPAFSPADLSPFVWFDPTDASTLFQERTGASATTAAGVGDPAGTMLDKSGNGYHLVAPSDGARWTVRSDGGLDFNGSTSCGSTVTTVDLTGTDEVTIIRGLRRNADTTQVFYETSGNWTANTGSFISTCESGIEFTAAARGSGTALASYRAAYQGSAAPELAVLTTLHTISGDSTILKVNGVQADEATGDKGSGNFGNYTLFVGARNDASFFANMDLYGLIIVPRLLTAQEIADVEAWMAARSGVTLP